MKNDTDKLLDKLNKQIIKQSEQYCDVMTLMSDLGEALNKRINALQDMVELLTKQLREPY